MKYSVPQHIDKNQIFLVNFLELEGRWDPYYNQPKYFQLEKQLKGLNCPMSNLKSESLKIFSGLTPLSGGDSYVQSGGIYFLRSGDYREDNIIDFNNVIQIAPDIHNGLMKNSKLQYGDVLIAIVGATIGKIGVYCYDYESNINQAICAVRLKNNLNPLFVQCFYQTTIGQQLLNRIKRPVARANINLDEIGQLPIPLASKQKQEIIITVIDDAYKCRNKKLAFAKQKLASIDEYLLDELGITLPKNDFQKLDDRMFEVSFKELFGNRYDPFYYLVSGTKVASTLFANTQLKCIANIVKGNSITSDNVNKNGLYPVIAGGQTSPYNHDKYNFGGNVITVSASGAYSGYVWYHETPIFASDCSVIYSKDETKFLTRYIFEVLKLQQQQIYNLQQGAGQPHVYPEDLCKLNIPEVSLDKQTEIVAHISAIRAETKALEIQAEEVLTKAREEVEKMILQSE